MPYACGREPQGVVRTGLAVLVVSIVSVTTVAGQSATASLTGTVQDEQGLSIGAATVSVESAARALKRETVTNDEGYFAVAALQPGAYTLTIVKSGFIRYELTDIVLNVLDQRAFSIRLRVGAIQQTIEVKGGSPAIQTSPAVQTTIDRQFIENLPLNGRSFHALFELTPGVVLAKTFFTNSGQFSVNGQRSNSNYFTVDGVSANFGVTAGSDVRLGQAGGGSLPAVSVTGGFNNLASVDATEEFTIQTSTFAPEFGRTPGAQVSIVTRSGTNELRGVVFEYLRSDRFDANDWFANAQGLAKPALRQNDFGGVLGGPIVRNRSFFFFSYEGLRLRLPQTKVEVVPSMAARQAAGPGIRPLLDAFPQPNGARLTDHTAEFAASFSNRSELDATSVRIDQAVTSALTVSARYNHSPSRAVQRGSADFYSTSTVGNTTLDTDTLTGSATLLLPAGMLNELRVNWSRSRGATITTADDFGGAVVPPASFLFPSGVDPANAVFGALFLPEIKGFFVGPSTDNRQRQLNVVDQFTTAKSTHQLKFGVDYRLLMPINGFRESDHFYVFSGIAEALSGTVGFAQIFNGEASRLRPRASQISLFAQDEWRVTPRFTLTYGVRWDRNPPPSETTGNPLVTAIGLDNPPSATLAPPGTRLWDAPWTNFAPRAGMTYLLRESDTLGLVMRAGAGVFHDLGNGHAMDGTLGFPYSRGKLLFNRPYPLSAADLEPVPLSVQPPYQGLVYAFPDLKLPRTYQWNLAFEQSLGRDHAVVATYVGAVGRKLLRRELLNERGDVNPDFPLGIVVSRSAATSDYHGLQMRFQRRLSRGLQALATYTWAHSIDMISNDSYIGPFRGLYDPVRDRGPSDNDVRHSFAAAFSFDIPPPSSHRVIRAILGNWSLDSSFRARSATPVNVLTGVDVFGIHGFTETWGRPDVVEGMPFYIQDSTAPGGRRINPDAFSIPAGNRQGTLGRNALRGFPAWQEDFALRRQFTVRGDVRVQFRAEFFNVFNHPNFGDPGSKFTLTNQLPNPQFGRSTTMLARSLSDAGPEGGFSPFYQIGGPRSIQFALKVLF
jgi:outer membrane receptor protein involved in Fe transport